MINGQAQLNGGVAAALAPTQSSQQQAIINKHSSYNNFMVQGFSPSDMAAKNE